jgi:CheY-like chemotaxis protein
MLDLSVAGRIYMEKPHILIVDDDVYVVETLTTYLEIRGCRVTPAYGFRQAVEKLGAKEKVDLMILDYLMPDGSGTDLLHFLGDDISLQRPPVIMSSGVLDPKAPIWEELRSRLPVASQALIQAYVSKPYTLDAIDVAVHEVLGGDYIPEPRNSRQAKRV